MNTENITSLEELKKLAEKKFLLLKPGNHKKEGLSLQLPFKNYTEVSHLIIDIVKVSMMALDAADDDITDIKSPLNSIRGVLELIYHIIPLEEMQLLDIMYDLISDRKELFETQKNNTSDEK